ncbi:MAG: beta-lactamase family protein, partial [Gemmatimonadota bacterium]
MRRVLTTALAIASAPAVFQSHHALAQTEVAKLRLKDRIERELSAGETHVFRIDLRDDQFLFATVGQPGIDVVVRLLDPEGELLQEIDGFWVGGTEYVTFFPQESGEYRIEIVPFLDDAQPGLYAIAIERLEPAAPTESGRVDQLFTPWDRNGSPGAAIAVIQNGEIIHEHGYGLAQLEYSIPITPSTVFHVASVSKQFTAYAVAMLAQEGKLSLDDDIRVHLPDL